MIGRRTFMLGGACSLLVPALARAQPAAAPARVGVLASRQSSPEFARAFRDGLLSEGFADGGNLVLEYLLGDAAQMPALARELVRRKVDVIAAPSITAALAAKQATDTIPIVFYFVSDPVRDGLAKSLAHPGGNATGLASIGNESTGKRLELLKDLRPRMTRVAILWSPKHSDSVSGWKVAELAASRLGLQLLSLPVETPRDFESAFATARSGRPEALYVFVDPLVINSPDRIVPFVFESRIPSISQWRHFTSAGLLISYGPDPYDIARRAGGYIGKILKGAKPADMPIEQPTKFDLVVNLKTANALGLTIPESILLRADEVIR